MKQYFLALLGLFISLSVFSQTATATLDHNEIKIGEQTYVDIEVRFPAASETVMMPNLKDTLSKFIEIVDITKIDTAFDEEDISIKIFTQRITITSFDSGLHVIPPFKIKIGNQLLATEAILLTVNTIPIEAELDIKDISEIIEVPFSLWDWMLENRIAIGIFLLLILVAFGMVFLIKRLQNKPVKEFQLVIPKEAADTLAFKKLDELETKKLWQNNKVKEFQSELSFIVREYIENRFEIRALEMTTDEIITSMSANPTVDEKQKSKLHQVLLIADMAKFAKQQPVASENEDAFKFAKAFVEQTKFIEVEKVEPNETKGGDS